MLPALVISFFAQQQQPPPISVMHELPGELAHGGGSDTLQATPTWWIWYEWEAGIKEISFFAKHRALAKDPWTKLPHAEGTSYHITAVAPFYYDAVYVAGVLPTGSTVIEKWSVSLSGRFLSFTKKRLYESSEVTHVRTLAVAPNESYLLAQRHETGEIIRFWLPDMSKNVVLTDEDIPYLKRYNELVAQEHISQGHAFILYSTNTIVPNHLIWDAALDGEPDLVEEVSDVEWKARGYYDGVWFPETAFARIEPQLIGD